MDRISGQMFSLVSGYCQIQGIYYAFRSTPPLPSCSVGVCIKIFISQKIRIKTDVLPSTPHVVGHSGYETDFKHVIVVGSKRELALVNCLSKYIYIYTFQKDE